MRRLFGLLAGLLLALLTAPTTQAQGTTIERLTVSLLPQFDDPRLLIIYDATLSAPGEVFLGAPSGVELHAAAYANEAGELQEIEAAFEAASDGRFIRLDAPTREVRVEMYYDVVPDEAERSVTFELPRQRYDIAALAWIVTFPTESSELGAEPEMSPIGLNHLGMAEWRREAGPLPAGEAATQSVAWVRESDTPSLILPDETVVTQPVARSWWPYAVAALVFVVGGGLVADGIRRQRRKV